MTTPNGEQSKASRGGELPGVSMVEKHFRKLQQEEEEAAMEKLQSLMPLFGNKVRRAALVESDWVPEKAALVLRRFQVARVSHLKNLHKKRRKIFSALAKASRENEGAFLSTGDEKSSDDVDSDFSRNSKKRSRKEKRSKKSKIKKRVTKGRDVKKASKKMKKRLATDDFGKHGILRESDYASKKSEFSKWAMDLRRIDTESCSRRDEMKLFSDYVEEYNTGSLPHVKYYDFEAYHRKKSAKKSRRKGDALEEDCLLKDEGERQKEKERQRTEYHNRRIQEAYFELKTSQKASQMKEQELLRMKMKLAYKTGDTFTAGKIATRLKPDDLKDPGKTDLPDEEW